MAQTHKDASTTSQLRLDDPGESQRRRVDTLLSDLLKKFPPKVFAKKVSNKTKTILSARARARARANSVYQEFIREYQTAALPGR
jgi:hypothetical protein